MGQAVNVGHLVRGTCSIELDSASGILGRVWKYVLGSIMDSGCGYVERPGGSISCVLWYKSDRHQYFSDV